MAISAPYEGKGVVYLYRGGPNGLIVDDYQVTIDIDRCLL